MEKEREIETKEEFRAILSASMIDLDGFVQALSTFDAELQKPKTGLNLMLQTRNYDEAYHEAVNNCFEEFNSLKKSLSKIEAKRDKIKKRLQFSYFKKFYVDSHEFNQKVIELNDSIKKCKEKVDAQIIKCIEYFNERDVEIKL